ncbi:MAG: nicotinate phosphoribosyltransferase [Firmicutes bacterium]|nr:nicotinate phosphoribosyltransferase [Bacillota bacterium]
MQNIALLTDLYQLTMMNGYAETGTADKIAVFDLFYRDPFGDTPFAVTAGLHQAIEYIRDLRFTDCDIEYLKSLNLFGDKFFKRIKDFKFTGDIYAVREGEMVFPYEPILTVRAPIFQAQLLETALLNIINHQTLIATKAFRITKEAGKPVAEFGLRRAQGADAGVYGARASIIGGCVSTSNVFAGKKFGVRVTGTVAHSWIMSFETELEAFRSYANINPSNCLLLVDTYDTLKSGVPNAITVFNEIKAKGHTPIGIRLDSGDLAYLSKRARVMLDEAGFKDAKIFVSGDIDEHIIVSLKNQGAKIDAYGIGTKLITSAPNPALGGVFKLAGIYENGELVPKMKISDTPGKTTNPGFKTLFRIYENGRAEADLIALRGEKFDCEKPLTIFHPVETWKKKTFTNYKIEELSVKIFENGNLVYTPPLLHETVSYSAVSRGKFEGEYTRLLNPHIYKVDLSQNLFDLKHKILNG